MPLDFSLPRDRGAPPKDLEVRPRAVRTWIEQLTFSQGPEAGRRIAKHLEQLNRVRMDLDDRIEILALYRAPALAVLEEMEGTYTRSTLPLAPRALDAVTLAVELALAMAGGYQVALLEKAARRLAFGARKQMPGLAHQAMRFLVAALYASYRSYTPVPEGQWARMHALYLHADEEGFARDAGDEAAGESLEDAYCEALLVTLTDPYRLPPGDGERIVAQIRAARGLATLGRARPATPTGGHFIVPCDADRPPKPALGASDTLDGPHGRWLDANPLVERLRMKKYAAETGQLSARLKSELNPEILALLAELATLWGNPPKRSQRRDRTQDTAAICVGIRAVGHFVSLEPRHDANEESERVRRGITMPLHALPMEDDQPVPVYEWEVVDRSDGGLRVRRVAASTQVLRVGDVVGAKLPDRTRWAVAAVRWLTGLPDGGVECGLQFVSASARFAWLHSATDPEAESRPCLVVTSGEGEEALLAPSGTYADLREFEIDVEGGIARVRALDLIERTPRFELFQTQPS